MTYEEMHKIGLTTQYKDVILQAEYKADSIYARYIGLKSQAEALLPDVRKSMDNYENLLKLAIGEGK